MTEPKATFSACFGKAFLSVHPTKYAEILAKKMLEHKSNAYLINTGWVAGKYGVGYRIPLKDNRVTIDAIFDGHLEKAEYETLPILNLQIPKALAGVKLQSDLNPRNMWANKAEYDETARKLAGMFIENFKLFSDTAIGKDLMASGPQLK